ncbi:hypothetical protein ACKQTC_03925 [Peptococcus simiae]|uniref:AMMECR1 domain-containing protein n=1 Tax=Peptococcus simiae TaxID=1643805 RepID=A0ABW9GYH0_9FIRM
MITINQLETECRRALKKLGPDESLSVRTWKGDRGFTVSCTPAGYTLVEDGFQNKTADFSTEPALMKEIRRLAKREFPRSHKLRFTIIKKKEPSPWKN